MKIFEDGIEREATADEIIKIELRQAEVAKEQAELAKAETAKAKAKQTVLNKLGLTIDEVSALLS